MRALILPGMDGTGDLLAGFSFHLSPEFVADVVRYPNTAASGYDDLLKIVESRIPHGEDFVLIGESFSGPLAIRIAASRPTRLKGLVLCASFASSPRPRLRPLAGLLALPLPKPPVTFLMPFMMGRWTTTEWTRRQAAAIATLPSTVARIRLSEVMKADAIDTLGQLPCPILYLQATHDRLVPSRCWREIAARVPGATCVRLEGPHFILQHQPLLAAEAIKRHFLPGPPKQTHPGAPASTG